MTSMHPRGVLVDREGETMDGRARPPRLPYVDALRVALVALVIAHHAVEPYASARARWTILPDPPVPGLWSFLWVNAAFFMGLFFLLAGLFTAESFDAKGRRSFLADRARRLGFPLALGVLVLIPFQAWFHHRAYRSMPPIDYWTYFTDYFLGLGREPPDWPAPRFPELELGHLWFLEHLWIYALLYAGWRALGPRRPAAAPLAPPPGTVAIAAYAAALTLMTWAIRRWYPQDAWIGFLGIVQMEPAHLPQYATLFLIGIYAGPRRWLERMPRRRGFTWLAVGGGLAVTCYVAVATGLVGRLDSRSWLACGWESWLVTGLCVGLPVAFRELVRGGGPVLRGLGASAYAAYIVHFPIVMALQWLLIGAPWPVGIRIAVTVLASAGLTLALTHFVVLRLPGARRVL